MASPLRLAHLTVAATLAVFVSTPATADAIDGSWCDDSGRHLAIKGSTIVTPGGKEMQGQYTRHNFRYVVPANEPTPGQEVDMQLLNENTVQLRAGPSGASELWHRCKPETS